MPGVYRSIPATTTADIAIATGRTVLMGFAVEEDAGTPAVARFVLRDGTSASGTIVFPVRLAASSSLAFWFGDIDNGGIVFPTGLFLDMLSGSINGSLFLA